MKILLNTCFVLLVIKYWGDDISPLVLGNPFLQWVVTVFFALLIPVGFAKSLVLYFKSLGYPVLFLLFFSQQLTIPLVFYHMQYSVMLSVSYPDETAIKFLEGPSAFDKEKSRYYSAKLIFKEFGQKSPYKLDDGGYKIFQPTEQDIAEHGEQKKQKIEMVQLFDQLIEHSKKAGYLSLLYVLSFLIVVPITLLYEQKSS